MIFCLIFLVFLIIPLFLFAFNNDKEATRDIAVYSGSFDPLHIGHKAILEEISKTYDWVYLIVTPQNPLKERKSSNLALRVKNAHDALIRNGIFNVTVSDIEKDMIPPYYTVRTLDELKKMSPHNNFTLIIGADNLQNIREWKDYQRLLIEYGVLVFPRGGFGVAKLEGLKQELLKENPDYKIYINNTIIPSISSTEIRGMLEKNDGNVNKLLM
jgi:nicotinate-nucleotide adenylyltransferase